MLNTNKSNVSRPILSLGNSSILVKHLQVILNATVAEDSLIIHGVFGKRTQAAVMDFQRKHALTVDGIVGPKTWAMLDIVKISDNNINHPILYLRSTGKDVEYLQRRLNEIEFASLKVNGIFDQPTEEAVKKFQRYHDLVEDGITRSQTWIKLESFNV